MTSPYLLDDRSGQALRSIEAAIDEMSDIDPWRFYGDAMDQAGSGSAGCICDHHRAHARGSRASSGGVDA